MSIEFQEELKKYHYKLRSQYPKSTTMGLIIGSTLCALLEKSVEGDLIATAMLQAIRATEERWKEAQYYFKKQFKFKFDDTKDLLIFLNQLNEKTEKVETL